MVAPEVLDRIRREIILSGRDKRYPIAAYSFILHALEYCIAKVGEKRHVTGQEFARDIAEFAAKQFGPIAYDTLCAWNVTTTDDFGVLVYNMIDIGVMSRREEDRLEDFFSVLDLKEYFGAQEAFKIDGEFIRRIRGA